MATEISIYDDTVFWEQISDCFDDPVAAKLTAPKERFEQVKRWLEADWKYQLKTMNYKLMS